MGQGIYPDLRLMISGHGTIETVVQAIRQGAYDFIEKPFKEGRLLLMVERALQAGWPARMLSCGRVFLRRMSLRLSANRTLSCAAYGN